MTTRTRRSARQLRPAVTSCSAAAAISATCGRRRTRSANRCSATLSACSLIQLPQTIHFTRSETLAATRRLLERHETVVLLVRDAPSLAVARASFDVDVRLAPDLALACPLEPPGDPSAADVVWIAREDRESRGVNPEQAPEGVWRVDWNLRMPSAAARRGAPAPAGGARPDRAQSATDEARGRRSVARARGDPCGAFSGAATAGATPVAPRARRRHRHPARTPPRHDARDTDRRHRHPVREATSDVRHVHSHRAACAVGRYARAGVGHAARVVERSS